jgi:predicted ATPase
MKVSEEFLEYLKSETAEDETLEEALIRLLDLEVEEVNEDADEDEDTDEAEEG